MYEEVIKAEHTLVSRPDKAEEDKVKGVPVVTVPVLVTLNVGLAIFVVSSLDEMLT